jgi:outer membrane protein assembly factor BamD (BamD/ComL family)
MLPRMTSRLIACTLLSASAFYFSSCGSDTDLPIMAGNTQAAANEGEELYKVAKQADDSGKTSKAIELYDKTATRFPFAPSAPQARFRQAQLLEQQGDILESFEAYDQFLSRFQGSGLYSTALNRQASMAQAAADGDLKSSLLGLKTKLSLEKTVMMLAKLRANAPQSAIASKAQFTIGQLNEGKQKSKDAIAAYRQLVRDQPSSKEAPEALFRVGVILTAEADRGNQSQGNLDLAKEAFNDYLIQYPGHSLNAEARKLVASLGSRDLQRSYDIAEFYQKTGKTESAKVYYRDIIKNSKSGSLHDKARARLNELGE